MYRLEYQDDSEHSRGGGDFVVLLQRKHFTVWCVRFNYVLVVFSLSGVDVQVHGLQVLARRKACQIQPQGAALQPGEDHAPGSLYWLDGDVC